MKINQIKETVERVVRTEYITEDGNVFYTEAEAENYERTALFLVSKKLKRLSGANANRQELLDNGDECCEVEIFDIQTNEDLENLKKYVCFKASMNGATEEDIKSCFTSENGIRRKNFVFDNVTVGHEVLVFWSYDKDWFWTYRDGSLEGYFSFVKDQYLKIIKVETNN